VEEEETTTIEEKEKEDASSIQGSFPTHIVIESHGNESFHELDLK
jgi:hypothetical protein